MLEKWAPKPVLQRGKKCHGPHLIGYLIELGLSEAAGMGAGPISWQAIGAWPQVLDIRLSRREARILHQLSVEYVAEGRRAEAETCPPPWRGRVSERAKQVELARLQMLLG